MLEIFIQTVYEYVNVSLNIFSTDFLIFAAAVIDIVRRERTVHHDEIHKFAHKC